MRTKAAIIESIILGIGVLLSIQGTAKAVGYSDSYIPYFSLAALGIVFIVILILLRKKNKVTLSNFPSKVPEMMGYGIIPIVSKVGDYTDEYLTDGKDCIQVEKCSIEDGVAAIRKALQLSADERSRMVTVSQRFFDWPSTMLW